MTKSGKTKAKITVPPGFEDFNPDPYHKIKETKNKLKSKIPGWIWLVFVTAPAFIFEAMYVLLKSIGGGYYEYRPGEIEMENEEYWEKNQREIDRVYDEVSRSSYDRDRML